jgi:hypothetical protein
MGCNNVRASGRKKNTNPEPEKNAMAFGTALNVAAERL